MAEEYLFGVTLEGDKLSEVWDPEPKNEDSDSNQHFAVDQKLIIKMALLGAEAKAGEVNVLQVEAMGLKGPTKIPIAVLETGKTAYVTLDLSFPDPPVTFTLIKGSGPVHIVGHNLLEKIKNGTKRAKVDEGDLEDEDEEDGEPKKKKNKIGGLPKTKLQNNKGPNQIQSQKKK
ncbi:hypothetical protein QAD02_019371 [Eretmocerus hayati]|uniref:Uncharacterized protein n=1 Tax=Eretmocerus hayati TaxID=131215 RepID=A0ACC2PJV4_9HYME|nr:hypothetical protein QAD02_019371 [Eretmocerus hayati]